MWDMENLTASDFTVEYLVTDEMWHSFNSALDKFSREIAVGAAAPDHQGKGLPVVTFEAFLEHYFVLKLNQLPFINEDVIIRIANITFGFNNQELIALLTERGTLITKGELSKVPAVNSKIDELMKGEKRSEIIRPVAAFITFEQ